MAIGDWRNTGVDIRQGETYVLRAQGTWSIGPICGVTDASGAGVMPLCAGDPLGIGATGSTLIGKIGEAGRPFRVGKRMTLEAEKTGILHLKAYDLLPFDNTGSVTVTVSRRQASIAAAPPVRQAMPPPANAVSPPPSRSFPRASPAVGYAKAPENPNDIAVIIGNADYSKQGKDIPNVVPAYADAEGFKRYVTKALGVREGNIINLRDATSAQMVSVFGSRENHKGKLFNWVRPGRSNVTIYYAGHGAPAGTEGSAYMVPADADAATIELNGYSLSTLYRNLGKIPARSITVVLEACFSGAAQGGAVISNASPVFMKSKAPEIPPNVTVIAAGGANQMASWEKDKSQGLFTKYFLKGMSGEADAKPHGNGDGKVALKELKAYLKDTMTYYARRYYGRNQTAVIVEGGRR